MAAAVAAGAGCLALVATSGLPAPMFWIVAANLVLGYLYSGPPLPLKSSSGGTVAVLCLSGLLSYLAGFTVATAGGGVAAPTALVLFAGVAICWMVFVGVPAKDLSDIAGDAAAGRRTLGVLLGERMSRQVMVGAAVVLLAGFGVAVSLLRVRLGGVVLVLAAGVVAVAVAGPAGGPATRGRGPPPHPPPVWGVHGDATCASSDRVFVLDLTEMLHASPGRAIVWGTLNARRRRGDIGGRTRGPRGTLRN
ncbi:hypothetical protein GCM10020219_036610 [Nonomuraea dietziae]